MSMQADIDRIARVQELIVLRDKIARILSDSYKGPESFDRDVAARILALVSAEQSA